MKQPKLEIYHAGDGWRLRLIAANGEKMPDNYTRKSDAIRGAKRVIVLAQLAEIVVRKRGKR